MKVVSPGWRLNEVIGTEHPDLIHTGTYVFNRTRTLLTEDDEPACHVAFSKETNGLRVAHYVADLLAGTEWHSATRETTRGLMVCVYHPQRVPWGTVTEELLALEREVLHEA